MNALLVFYTVGIVAALWFGFTLGFAYGQRAGHGRGLLTGRAIGWRAGYFKRIADDKSKRDSGGRFIALHGGRS